MVLDKGKMYRFPWSMNDNPIGWLEVTDACNLGCKGCYRQKLEGHKSLETIKEEVLFLKKWRNCDHISIAGGEPALHPQIIDIIRFIKENGMKPFLLSNGMALSKGLLKEMKKEGLLKVGLHIDSFQGRPGWDGKNELDLCALREQYADMVNSIGGLTCGFGITVYKENFSHIPALIRWTLKNLKRVRGLTFITYRAAIIGPGRDYLAGGKKVNLDAADLGYASKEDTPEDIGITSTDVYRLIKNHFPQYEASAYLGGTKRHDSFKWIAGYMLTSGGQPLGSLGQKSMELAQSCYHLLFGRYFVYTKRKSLGRGVLALSLFDPEVRKVAKQLASSPLSFFKPFSGLSIGIVQAPDTLPDGDVDMCDSCPDMAVYKGRLVHSCRMDEYRKYGGLLTLMNAEKKQEETAADSEEANIQL